MLQRSVNKYDSIFIKANSTPVQLNTTNTAAGSNDTAVNSTVQELLCSGKIKIRLIQY